MLKPVPALEGASTVSTTPIREAATNLVELMIEGLRPNDNTLNALALRAILNTGPVLLDELICRAFDAEIRPGHRARLIEAITLLSPGHEQHVGCYDTDRFLEDRSPRVRRAARELHARIRAATETTPPTSMVLASTTTRRDGNAQDPVVGASRRS